ncbi:MAG: hypothetical protein WAV90_19340 [Gordonia amarae]
MPQWRLGFGANTEGDIEMAWWKRRNRPAARRLADVHMWTIRSRWTSRIQAFRDESGRAIALVTLRDGDVGASHVNGAEKYRDDAWEQFFPEDQAPPILIFNLLDPLLRLGDSSPIVAVEFDSDGYFRWSGDANAADIEVLDRLGAEWDAGSGYVPYTPPPPTYVQVLRRIAVRDLPPSDPFRGLDDYLSGNWDAASRLALTVAMTGNPMPANTPPDIAAAARSLLDVPIDLIRDPGEPVRFMNGQHRAEAMRRQGVTWTIVSETRKISGPPLPGEIKQLGTC